MKNHSLAELGITKKPVRVVINHSNFSISSSSSSFIKYLRQYLRNYVYIFYIIIYNNNNNNNRELTTTTTTTNPRVF